jgi:phage tail protein X
VVEEAKDIRELKSLLSGLALPQDAGHASRSNAARTADAYAQKIALLKSVSVLFFSLSLFLLLALLFALVGNYRTNSPDHDATPTAAIPRSRNEVPPAAAPVVPASVQPPVASPALQQPELTASTVVPPQEDARTVVLKEEGGSLYFIAMRHYGKADETIYDLILQANPAIVDVRKIDDQQKIVVPSITAESYVKGSVQDGYRIHVGTYETAQWADIYGARVKSAEKRIIVEPQQYSSRDTWYRLMLGDFTHKEEALQTVRALAKKGMIYMPPSPG